MTQKGTLMFFKKETPLQLVNKLLAEMPWLWAVKQHWGSNHQIKVIQVDGTQMLDYVVARTDHFGHEPEVTRCYVHFEHSVSNWVRNEGVGVGKTEMSMYDVLGSLYALGSPTESIRHIITHVGGRVTVYRPAKSTSFEELFKEKARERSEYYVA